MAHVRVALALTLLGTTLAACQPAASTAPSPSTAVSATPVRSVASISPSPSSVQSRAPSPSAGASPSGSGAGETNVCESVAEFDVAALLGAEIISIEPRDPTGSSLGGCEWVASNSASLRVGVNDASDWDEFVTMFGNEPAGDVEGLYYSEIVGLSWRPPDSETYLSVWLPVHDDLESHVRALALVLGRQ